MKKHLLYNVFHRERDDLPDLKAENTEPTLGYFFKLLGRKFWKLISLNAMMLPMIFPVLIAIALYLGVDKTPSENTVLFSQLYGANLIHSTTDSVFLLDLFGTQYLIPVYQTTGTYIGIGACALFLLVTFGWQNVGAAYVLRGIVRGDAVFLLSDYFYAIKRNLKQGFFLGLLDFTVIFLLVFDFLYFYSLTGSFFMDVMFFAICALAILYFFMRFYLYLLQVTFHLSIRKILKNALIFTTLGVKRNLMAFLGIALITAINIFLFAILMPLNIAIPLILPFLYYLSFTTFMATYAAYPVIDRYMIAPFRKDESDESEESEESEA